MHEGEEDIAISQLDDNYNNIKFLKCVKLSL